MRIDSMEKGYNGYHIFNKNSINLLTSLFPRWIKTSDVCFERFGNTTVEKDRGTLEK